MCIRDRTSTGRRVTLSPPCLASRARRKSGVMARSRTLATWDARSWIAGLIGCDPSELSIRSADTYGTETQTRYERGGEAVARLTVAAPVQSFSDAVGKGHRAVTAPVSYTHLRAHETVLDLV